MQNNISQKRQLMLIYALPNFILSVFAVGLAVYEFGWESLLSFPFVILLVWLIYSGVIAFILRWQETGEKSEAQQVIDKIQELINEIRQERNERNADNQ